MLVRLAQLTIVAVPLALFGWLVNQELVPTGTFEVRHAVSEASPFIDRLLPDARVTADGTITDDPVFFFVHPHRQFDTVEADVWFKNDSVPIVELGGLANVEAQAYDLKPLQNRIIDTLGWLRLEKDGLVLLQRKPTYTGIADFLANPPPVGQIATYQTSLPRPFTLAGYVPSDAPRTVDVTLRGFHQFKTYVKGETLAFDFAYMDMNRDGGADAVSLVVTNAAGETVADARASDDGNVGSDGVPSALSRLSVRAPGLPEGVYTVTMQSDRDIFWRTIQTTQRKMVFLNNVFLGDEVGYKADARPVSFWTEAKHLSFVTRHAEGTQTVRVGSTGVSVSQPYARATATVADAGVVEVAAQKPDLEVTTDGHVAFAPDLYFDPDPVRLTPLTDLDALGVNYVLAQYVSPETVGMWNVAHVTFDASKLVLDQGAWKFVVSTPNIKDLGASMQVGRIDMTWNRKPFTLNDLYDAVARAH